MLLASIPSMFLSFFIFPDALMATAAVAKLSPLYLTIIGLKAVAIANETTKVR